MVDLAKENPRGPVALQPFVIWGHSMASVGAHDNGTKSNHAGYLVSGQWRTGS